MLLVDRAHKRSSRWQDLIDEDEDGFLRRKLDALADDIDELANGEIGRYKVLLLVDGSNVRFLDLLTDHLGIEGYVRLLYCNRSSFGRCGERLTGIRSAYFCRMRSASALRFSKGCSSLNLERMLIVVMSFSDGCRCASMEVDETFCRVGDLWKVGDGSKRRDAVSTID